MAGVHFYLKKPEKATGKSLIFLQWKYNGRILRFSFGQTINPKDWSKKQYRVKDKSITTESGDILLNDLLDKLVAICKETYNKLIKEGIPTPDMIKEVLRNFMEQNEIQKDNPTLFQLLEKFMNNEFLYDGRSKSKHTVKTYKTVFNHLHNFEKKCKFKVAYDSINEDFAKRYSDFLKSNKMSHNTITKHFKAIIAVMNKAYLNEYTRSKAYKREAFSFSYKETDAVYLTDEEIRSLYLHDFSSNKKLERIRDLFVLGCVTGLRFSDFSKLTSENIAVIKNQEYFRIITQKTKETVFISCHPIAIEILSRYSNKLPKPISNQKFNVFLKEVCKEVGLIETGRLMTEPEKELYKCVGSHTCRRSFATNLYLNGAANHDIMKVTGHRTEKAFLAYIKVSKVDSAKRVDVYYKNTDLRIAM